MMFETGRWIQLVVFALLATLSYAIFNQFFSQDTSIEYEPFTKGYSLEGVVMRSSNEAGDIVSTVESPLVIHYADTEMSVIKEPRYIMHQSDGDWVFESEQGEINKDQTALYFPGQVHVQFDAGQLAMVSDDLLVNIDENTGRGQGKIKLEKPGLLLTGLGSVINFTEQSIEILEDYYAEFEN